MKLEEAKEGDPFMSACLGLKLAGIFRLGSLLVLWPN